MQKISQAEGQNHRICLGKQTAQFFIYTAFLLYILRHTIFHYTEILKRSNLLSFYKEDRCGILFSKASAEKYRHTECIRPFE